MKARTSGVDVKKPWYRSARFWLSTITFLLVAVLVAAAWPQVLEAIRSLTRVNLWVLSLLIPLQLLSYWVTGETLFSFLRSRGELRGMHPMFAMRMSLEFNFANHMLPSGGAAGIAYTSWKLSTLGVPASRSTLAQFARFGVTFVSFTIMLVAATVWLMIVGQGSSLVFWAAGLVGVLSLGMTLGGVWILRRRRMLHRLAGFATRVINGVYRLVRSPRRMSVAVPIRFLDGLYLEVGEVTAQPKTLVKPFLWSFVVNATDALLFVVALLAFGIMPDLGLVFVAYGLATLVSMVVVTPNGLGAYEVAMVATLVSGGLPQSTTIAAIVLTRVVLMLGTIVGGWGFYQHSVITSGAKLQAVSRGNKQPRS